MTVAGGLTLALLAGTEPRISSGRELEVSAPARGLGPAHHERRGVVVPSHVRTVPAARANACQPAVDPSGYVNPLSGAVVVPKRIDQGVDYVGSGTLTAMGAARIIYLATVDTGWPGAFIEYRLLGGPENGCYVYYAEGVKPVAGVYVGQTVRAGQPVAAIVSGSTSGIEIGWAAGDGTKSYASDKGEWSPAHEADNIPSAAGLYFSELIAALGGPPGKIEG